jgi:hypothetical protein
MHFLENLSGKKVIELPSFRAVHHLSQVQKSFQKSWTDKPSHASDKTVLGGTLQLSKDA